jgi:hypothetical protein
MKLNLVFQGFEASFICTTKGVMFYYLNLSYSKSKALGSSKLKCSDVLSLLRIMQFGTEVMSLVADGIWYPISPHAPDLCRVMD